MTLKEGRCPNCGSILQLNEKAEQGHCLFCDAVFENSHAFEIALDSTGIEFPNEPQPKYEGPSLDVNVKTPTGVKVPPPRKQQPRRTAEPQPQYINKEKIKLPEVKLSARTRIKLILVCVVIIALILGIGIPTVTKRDNDRAAIIDLFKDKLPMTVDTENAIAIRHVANNLLLLALPDDITAEQAMDIYMDYSLSRAEVRKETDSGFDRIYGKVDVRIFTPEGGYKINDLETEKDLNPSSIKILN